MFLVVAIRETYNNDKQFHAKELGKQCQFNTGILPQLKFRIDESSSKNCD